MSKLLYILRHAKAEFAADYAEDHARPLNPRGKNDAVACGNHMRSLANPPQLALCSTATRTRETYDALGLDIPVAYSDKLYLANVGELLHHINALPAEIDSALIVGHNPGMHELTAILTHHAENDADTERLREKFPTCTLATLSFTKDWAEITPDSATLKALHTPTKA